VRATPAEAHRLLLDPGWDESDPLLVVDACDLQVPPAFPAVVVAVSDSPIPVSGADVAICSAGPPVQVPWVSSALDPLSAVVGASPIAAVTLVQVLRLSGGLPVESGLAIESLAYSVLQGGPEFARWAASRKPAPKTPTSPTVVVSRAGSTLLVELNRPEAHNAYSRHMRDELFDALTIAAADPEVTVELSGRGPSFCSGGDLKEFGTSPDPATAHLIRTSRSPGRLIHFLSSRITARLHGSCIGSGIELPAFAGNVIADPDTRIRLPELSMGLIPGAGGTVSLPRRIGRERTAWLALTGEYIDATTALDWGLVDEVS
jgi:hypothetical protein